MQHQDSDDDGIDAFGGPPSVDGSSSSSRPASPFDVPTSTSLGLPMSSRSPPRDETDALNITNGMNPDIDDHLPGVNNDQTTLLQNEEEGFALAPVDTTTVKGMNTYFFI